MRSSHVPLPQVVQHPAGIPALQAALEPRAGQVFVLRIPGIAHGGVHVADVQLVGPGQHALGDAVVARDHQVVARDVQLLDGQRHQRQVGRIFAPRQWQPLQKGRADRSCRPGNGDRHRSESRPSCRRRHGETAQRAVRRRAPSRRRSPANREQWPLATARPQTTLVCAANDPRRRSDWIPAGSRGKLTELSRRSGRVANPPAPANGDLPPV